MKLEYIPCNLCGSESTKSLFSKSDDLTGEKIDFSIVQCTECGLIYINPRPSIEEISAFYPKEFLSYQFEVYKSKDITLKERLVSFVVKSSAKQKLQTVQKFIQNQSKLKVLDIGCGKGGFLCELKDNLGWDVTGIDFDKTSVDFCRNELAVNVIQGGVDCLDQLDKDFDLVTMWHFFEHEYDPLTALKKINGCLKNGEYLLIEVPNASSLENKVFGKNSYLYDVPRHLYNFSPDTLSKYLEKTGFEIQSIRFPHFSGGWLGSVQGFFFRNKIYTNLKKYIFLFLLISLLLAPLEILLGSTKKGSIMTVFAKKVGNCN